MARMKKNPSVAVVALMLALLVLAAAPGGARSACNASQLAVCLSAITGEAAPTAGCCANLKAPVRQGPGLRPLHQEHQRPQDPPVLPPRRTYLLGASISLLAHILAS
ncbi:hypothetical protein QYE76_071573 [Lolium multiflorum]|uniref:Bifunctional inhibitor/plant lipid transfer protein/seed storage helical domain-containing protein n=1 Tax=Lolium multiflorum TaxID=4521 RepID=A0AAD8SLL6_LOLMU|nr:hypothetical protein QYE76_071573 [Lolium multiflorum]